MKPTKQQVLSVFELLQEYCEYVNDTAYEPNERGRDNVRLELGIWDDGSGRFGYSHGAPDGNTFHPILVFEKLQDLVDHFAYWMELSK